MYTLLLQVSMTNTVMVDTNVNAVLRPLTEKEREVQEEIERRFFELLPQKHWEGWSSGNTGRQ